MTMACLSGKGHGKKGFSWKHLQKGVCLILYVNSLMGTQSAFYFSIKGMGVCVGQTRFSKMV